MDQSTHQQSGFLQFTDLLRRSAGVRSTVYLGSMAGLLALSNAAISALITDPKHLWYRDMNSPILPIVLAVTYAFARLRQEDVAAWHRLPSQRDMLQFLKGAGFGSAAILSVFAMAATQGWVSAPKWGWETVAPAALAQTIGVMAFQRLLGAWEEELVFRGYGLDTLRQAAGLPGAIAISALLFGPYHGSDPQVILPMVLLGLMFTALRLESGSLWLPVGFHFAWNITQVGLVGPVVEQPSIRPVHFHGPTAWIGEPGTPEIGILSMLVVGAVTLIAMLSIWKRAQRREQ